MDIHNIPGSIHEASISAMCLRRLKYDYVAFVMYSLLLLYIELTEIPILFTLLFRVVRSTHASKFVAIPLLNALSYCMLTCLKTCLNIISCPSVSCSPERARSIHILRSSMFLVTCLGMSTVKSNYQLSKSVLIVRIGLELGLGNYQF